jgi:hypothetical protein
MKAALLVLLLRKLRLVALLLHSKSRPMRMMICTPE